MNITFDNVSFKYIEKKILDKASFSVTTTDKVGVVGVNGTGKSTMLKLIMGLENPNSGEIIKTGGMRINYLAQDPKFDPNMSLLDIIMVDSTKDNPILDYEAKSILSKLGFVDSSITTANFSGGELKRVALAKVLVTPCDFLILDEPTNHLDNELIMWLEKFLIKFKKGIIMVTHDRYFLQRVCNKMLELDFGKTYLYEANYDKFLELKAERILQEKQAERKLKSILKNEAEWLSRGVEARRTKSKSRIERFNELSKIEFNEEKTMEFSSISKRLGKKLISLVNVSKSYGDNVLFTNFSFDLNKDDIIGVVGDNGAGKSTLFKMLMGLETPTSGEIIKGETLEIGYFSQHLELIDPEIRVIDYIKDYASDIETLDGKISASDLLERFLFDSNLQYSKVKMLSGGEKRRLQLVKVLISNPNMLLFDEPTNDLDIYTLELLEDYLLSFKGPIMVVSHDRYFLDKICNKLLCFNNNTITESLLSFSKYLETSVSSNKIESKEKEEPKERKRNRLPSAIKKEIEEAEINMPKMEERIAFLSKEINNSSYDYTKLMDIQEELDRLEKDYNSLMERYFELLEIKENYD
ncbi:MAG: ABC-F family ATP-binding cassette domain-containing protein [Acholeplasmatales bacterium]|nr:ABC-F family ATP-binding cassette domain-containing protein [Acholeplasmatales bacterium]